MKASEIECIEAVFAGGLAALPQYELLVTGDGFVRYISREYRDEGRACSGRLPVAEAEALMGAVASSGVASMEPLYELMATDIPTMRLDVHGPRGTHTVIARGGAPTAFYELHNRITLALASVEWRGARPDGLEQLLTRGLEKLREIRLRREGRPGRR